ncbi:hypothetical protein [Paracraurococcus lichenis]|uniref:DUF1795 domain-containing protein n=1 Tax=Paracraurococcus lichenis TaxID=3064888 RepID=A0ABT9DTS5_9PROT|nr:hypothetical protein [Paracraurococcus sp. LOR1-02]MDO9707300.1 hypothetical protein [Paracraurococcus sp. LOR1-02]
MRRALLLSCLLLAAPAARAQAPFTLPEADRMRLVTHGLGWTVLRDATAPHGAAEMGMLLVRAQRPVPAAARPGHLARTLQNLRTLHVGPLPAEEHADLAGLPADLLQARATGVPSGVPVVVRAACLYGPARSWLLVASAPVAEWPGLEAEMARLIAGFRPG